VPASEGTIEAVPLIPRRRLVGSSFGGYASIRRGAGTDVAGSRPYQPGDHFHAIDWKASAKLSAARGSDEFIVRDRYAEEMPRVVIVVDRRPEMALFPNGLPWLRKPEAVALATRLLVTSAVNQRGLVGYLDYSSHADGHSAGAPYWHPPRAQASAWRGDLVDVTIGYLEGPFDAPDDGIERALSFLSVAGGTVTTGSFVFVISDFLVNPPDELWTATIAHGWDVVPVVVQDPVWERSFPPIAGITTPFVDPRTRSSMTVRLSRREVGERRAANELRAERLTAELAEHDLDAVLITSCDQDSIRAAFLDWADGRLARGGLR
jgi:hypothetical protein